MQPLQHLMADDHRRCDLMFVDVERAVQSQAWEQASTIFARFQHAVLQHFETEESLLFPAFEKKTGMTSGPTQVMRGEHVQMRELMADAQAALAEKDADDYLGNAETLLIMMQQHNTKEENVLYPMCDQVLVEQVGVLLPQLQSSLQE